MNLVVNGVLLQFTQSGAPDRPAVLLLHGWGASSRSFDGLAAALSPHYRVVLLDLPGHGGSEIPPPDWHVQDFARLVSDFCAKAGLGRLHALGGHSFGGRVAIKAVSEGLVNPDKLLLMGTAGVKHSDTARNTAFKLAAKAGKVAAALPGVRRLKHRLRRRLYQAAGSTDYLDAGPMRQVFLNTIGEDLQAAAAQIKTPTLLIWGETDADTPLADGRLLAGKIAGSKLEVIPGAGHYVFLDAPEPTGKLVEEFLA